MKRYVVLGIIVILIAVAIVFFFNRNDNSNKPFGNSEKNENESRDINEELAENRVSNVLENANEIMQNISDEQEISSFSTAIKDKEAGRLTNIGITCNTLNNTIIRKRGNFLF